MKAIFAGAAALAMFAAGTTGASASSSGDPVFDDMKCFVVIAELPETIEDADEELEQSAMMMVAYFVGKMFGRDPGFDIAQANETYADRIDAMDYEIEFERCLAEFNSVGDKMVAAGQ